jgi:putative transposase
MIVAVSLRLLYLIFQHLLWLLLLMGRTSRTKEIELLVLRHEVTVLRVGAENRVMASDQRVRSQPPSRRTPRPGQDDRQVLPSDSPT